MKKTIALLIILTFSVGTYSQSKKQIQQFEKYKSDNRFEQDEQNIVVSKVIENVEGSKEDIYIKVKSFFAHNYNDANSVIQTDDKEKGIIIGKGIFSNLKKWTDLFGNTSVLGAYHILRVDIKEGRIRVICNANEWNLVASGSKYKNADIKDGLIVNHAPFTKKSFADRGKQTEAFVLMVDRMHNIIENLEKSLFEGNLKVENEDW